MIKGLEMTPEITTRQMLPADWNQVAAIYEQGIATGMATFETKVPSWEEWDSSHIQDLRFVAHAGGKILGWSALSPVSSRCVYGGVAEVSVYIGTESRRLGLGETLLQLLIDESEKNGYWTLQSGIFPENKGSIALHEKLGFRILGIREQIGALHGVWKDNVVMERRSKKVGIPNQSTISS